MVKTETPSVSKRAAKKGSETAVKAESKPPSAAKAATAGAAKPVKAAKPEKKAAAKPRARKPAKKPTKKGEEPYPEFEAPTPEQARVVTAALAGCHGARPCEAVPRRPPRTDARRGATAGEPTPPSPRPILDSLVRTILSQNTTDKTSLVAFERLKAGLPTRRAVFLPRRASKNEP